MIDCEEQNSHFLIGGKLDLLALLVYPSNKPLHKLTKPRAINYTSVHA